MRSVDLGMHRYFEGACRVSQWSGVLSNAMVDRGAIRFKVGKNRRDVAYRSRPACCRSRSPEGCVLPVDMIRGLRSRIHGSRPPTPSRRLSRYTCRYRNVQLSPSLRTSTGPRFLLHAHSRARGSKQPKHQPLSAGISRSVHRLAKIRLKHVRFAWILTRSHKTRHLRDLLSDAF